MKNRIGLDLGLAKYEVNLRNLFEIECLYMSCNAALKTDPVIGKATLGVEGVVREATKRGRAMTSANCSHRAGIRAWPKLALEAFQVVLALFEAAAFSA